MLGKGDVSISQTSIFYILLQNTDETRSLVLKLVKYLIMCREKSHAYEYISVEST